jgi:hypothetical protein
MPMTKRYSVITVTALLLAVGAAGAVAAGDDNARPSAGHERAQSVDPSAAAAIGLLREQRTSADDMPGQVAARIAANAPFGVNPGLSRLAIGNATSAVYVIPASGHLCASLTVGDGASLTCPSTGDVAGGRAAPVTVTVETGGIAIYGIVPDGVESVTIRTADSATELATERNAYYTVVPRGTALRSVGYDGPGGQVEFPAHDPSAALEGSR